MCIKMRVIYLLLCFLLKITNCVCLNSNEINKLTTVFFKNLEATGEGQTWNTELEKYVDQQIENYLYVMQNIKTGKYKEIRKKRNEEEYFDQVAKHGSDVYKLSTIKEIHVINLTNIVDSYIFSHNNLSYAAILNNNVKDNFYVLRYSDEQKHFVNESIFTVANANQVTAYVTKEASFVLVLQKENDQKFKVSIFIKTGKKSFEYIQDISFNYDIKIAGIWNDENEVYLLICNAGSSDYTTNIYKWLGGHFDIIQNIPNRNVIAAKTFKIGNLRYLAFAANISGSNIEIYKFDLNSAQFRMQQKLVAGNVRDIETFKLHHENGKSSQFMIVAQRNESIVYVTFDSHFIPFEAIEDNMFIKKWFAVEGPRHEFVLLGITENNAAVTYQYNGFKFIKVNPYSNILASFHEVVNVLYYTNAENPEIILTDDAETYSIHIIELHFTHKNELKEFYEKSINWCQQALSSATKLTRHSRSIREDKITENASSTTTNSINLLQNVEKAEDDLSQISFAVENLKKSETTITGNLNTNEVVISSSTANHIHHLHTKSINDDNIDNIISNVIRLDEDINFRDVEISSVTIENEDSHLNLINNITYNNYIFVTTELNLEKLILNGGMVFEENFIVLDKVNDFKFSKNHILLNRENQIFDGALLVQSIKANNTIVHQLNSVNLPSTNFNFHREKLDSLEVLNVKSIVIGGFINNVDLPTLDKYALRNRPGQVLSEEYIFDTLITKDLGITDINNKTENNFINIQQGQFAVLNEVEIRNLNVENLVVLEKLNELSVNNFKLDVLLKNSSEMQEINGEKTFMNLQTDSINLRTKINNDRLKELNNVLSIENEILKKGDLVIQGNVTIESILKVQDMMSKGFFTISNLEKFGLKLNERETDIQLNFKHQFQAAEIFADLINLKDTSSWVVNGDSNNVQYITGSKIFESDIIITGDTEFQAVNDINLQNLDNDVLKHNGDQTFTGKHHLKNVHVTNLNTSDMYLKDVKIDNMTFNHMDTLTLDATTFDKIVSKAVIIKGLINEIDINATVQDTAMKNQVNDIKGHKQIKDLIITNLTSASINMNDIQEIIQNSSITLESAKLNDNITIENIVFKNTLNGINASDFAINWIDNGTIYNQQYINDLVILGQANVESNKLNGIDLKSLVNDTIKTDEPFHSDKIEFEILASMNDIRLNGAIERLDLNNIVAGDRITIESSIFNNDVLVNGFIRSKTLNGVPLEELCNFANPFEKESTRNIQINGSLITQKGPIINEINEHNIEEIYQNIWLSNTVSSNDNINLQAYKIIFKDTLTINNRINDIQLDEIDNSYFSLTKNQTISSAFKVKETVIFDNGMQANATYLKHLNGINVDTFIRTALIDNTTQVFEEILFARECEMKNVNGKFTLNRYNIDTDLMRYDLPNVVTGPKKVKNIKIHNYVNYNHNLIQGIDMFEWITKSILKSAANNIEGMVVFNNNTIFEKGINLKGLLNKNVFDESTVLLKSIPQQITGQKMFIPTNSLRMKSVKLTGLLNNANLETFINNQIYKTGDYKVDSVLDFNNNITVKNLDFNRLYNGINISAVLCNLSDYIAINGYIHNYMDIKETAENFKTSLEGKAYYLKYYKKIQTIKNANTMFTINNFYNDISSVALITLNGNYNLHFYQWNATNNIFIKDAETIINGTNPFVTPVKFALKSYLYVEKDHFEPLISYTRIGHILVNNNGLLQITTHIYSNGTKIVLPLVLPSSKEECLLFVYHDQNYVDIIKNNAQTTIHQKLLAPNVSDLNIMEIENVLYIITTGKSETGAQITFWKMDEHTELFNKHQIIHSAKVKSLSSIAHSNNYYVSVGTYEDSYTEKQHGSVVVYRYDRNTMKFYNYQQIFINKPRQVRFSILPTNELILLALNEDCSDYLKVYGYNGISKFARTDVASIHKYVTAVADFSVNNNHFIAASSANEVTVLKAIFKS